MDANHTHCRLSEHLRHHILLNVMGPDGPGLACGHRVTFFWLFMLCEGTLEAFTSTNEICDLLGRSQRCANEHIKALADLGYIEILEWDKRTGRIHFRIPDGPA